MNALRSILVLFCLTLLCTAISSASGPATLGTGVSVTRVNGPAPVPLCPPEEGWCSTMPEPAPQPHAVNGPAPVPLCPPEEGWCSTMPEPAPQPHAVNGPAPVPLCPPEEGWCSTMPEPAPQPHAVNPRDAGR